MLNHIASYIRSTDLEGTYILPIAMSKQQMVAIERRVQLAETEDAYWEYLDESAVEDPVKLKDRIYQTLLGTIESYNLGGKRVLQVTHNHLDIGMDFQDWIKLMYRQDIAALPDYEPDTYTNMYAVLYGTQIVFNDMSWLEINDEGIWQYRQVPTIVADDQPFLPLTMYGSW